MDKKRKTAAVSMVYKAGAYLSRMFGKSVGIREKGYLDFVSEADRDSEKMMLSSIKLLFPDDGVLSEESKEKRGKTGYRWIIDPLDGTHNFLKGLQPFGVLLALEKDGEAVLGICYFPALGEFFLAEKGRGAFCNDERIRVSGASEFRGEIFCPDGIMRKKPKIILADIEVFCSLGCRFRVYGSSPFAFTRVALGRAVIAANRWGQPWDIAAPALIVEEAGGKVTDETGRPWRVDSENLLATNGVLHDRALKFFSQAI